ncbi:hypothetical protein [Microseira wollei]|nr:hypothetical protein [Microseira wollei]
MPCPYSLVLAKMPFAVGNMSNVVKLPDISRLPCPYPAPLPN